MNKPQVMMAIYLLLAILSVRQTYSLYINSVSIGNTSISAITNYTWSIKTSNFTLNQSTVLLTFPSVVIITNNTFSTDVNGITVNSSMENATTIRFNLPLTIIGNQQNITVVVSNLKNPPYQRIMNIDFVTMIHNQTIRLDITTTPVQTIRGRFPFCQWTFNGLTEDTSSTLTIIITTKNQITIGNRNIQISYPVYSNSLYLAPTSPLTCSLQYSNISITPTCLVNNNKVSVSFTLTTNINISTNITIQLTPINNPPTMHTSSTSFILISYFDSSQVIDESNTCTIKDIPVKTITSTFSNSQGLVNSTIVRPLYTVTVGSRIQQNDIVEMSFSNQLVSCTNNFLLFDNSTLSYLAFQNQTTNLRIYKINNSITGTFSVNFDCNFVMPPSTLPSLISLTYKRNNSPYLVINSMLTSTIDTILSANVVPINTQLLALTDYTFTIQNKHSLNLTPQIVITMDTSVNLGTFNNSCNILINGVNISTLTCKISNTNKIEINISNLATTPSNSTIIIIIKSLSNPSTPGTKSFTITIVYDYNLPTGQVQRSNTISFQPTPYILTTSSITPTNTFQVYRLTQFTITHQNVVPLPFASIYQFTFPIGFTSLTFLNFTHNNTLLTPQITTLNNTISLLYNAQVPSSNSLKFSFSAIMPSATISSTQISWIVTNNNQSYEKSSVQIKVTILSTATFTIVPSSIYTGVFTSYLFNFITSVPHPSQFILRITFPNSTSYQNNNSSIGGDRNLTQPVIQNGFVLDVVLVGTQSQRTYNLVLGDFQNRRSVGTSASWSFNTLQMDGSLITMGSNTVTINQASSISAKLNTSDRYYRNNSKQVNIQFNLTNSLISTDKILIQISKDIYTQVSNVSCTDGSCLKSNQSIAGSVLVIQVSNKVGKSFSISISGLVSSPSTFFGISQAIYVQSKTQTGELIDEGTFYYSISCNSPYPYQCQMCTSNGTCLSCYITDNRYLINGQCVSDCTTQTSFKQYNSPNATCVACQFPCTTCYTLTSCRSCSNDTIPYYLYMNQSCIAECKTLDGFYKDYTNNIQKCLACVDTNCATCINGGIDCVLCKSNTVLQNSKCTSTCFGQTYLDISSSSCKTCDVSCIGCRGGGNQACTFCNALGGYKNYSGSCINGCPTGTVLINNTECGCDSICSTCQTQKSFCLICINSKFAYQGRCYDVCPNNTYSSGFVCIDCTSGCSNCTSSGCIQCRTTLYLYQNKCYSDCNSISLQHHGLGKACVLCRTGCDTCNDSECYSCLQGYTYFPQNKTCAKSCSINNTCQQINPVPSRILPCPGIIASVGWIGIVFLMKMIISKLYIPYSYLVGGAVIQLIVQISLVNSVNALRSNNRLLAAVIFSPHHQSVLALLISSILLNYLMNFLYIFIFCKYIKKFISQKQIDQISNYAVLILATLFNYRFGLLSYSKMFPKPNINIDNPSKITPVHYMCMVSLLLSVLSLAASGLIIYSDYPLTDIFMLAIDLLVVTILNAAFSIWMVSVSKPDEYFDSDIKKYSIQQNHFKTTEENLNNTFDKQFDQSNGVINFQEPAIANVSQKQQEDYQRDAPYKKLQKTSNFVTDSQINYPINKQNISVLNPVQIKIENGNQDFLDDMSLPDKSIIRKNKKTNDMDLDRKNIDKRKIQDAQNNKIDNMNKANSNVDYERTDNDQGLNKRQGQISNDYTKVKTTRGKAKRTQGDLRIKKQKTSRDILIREAKRLEDDFQDINEFSDKPSFKTEHIDDLMVNKYDKKPPIKSTITQRQSSQRKSQMKNMSKKNRIGYLDSETNEPNLDEVDLQSIIKNKIVNITDSKINNYKPTNSADNEDISPSWFNIPNQRFDFTDQDSI